MIDRRVISLLFVPVLATALFFGAIDPGKADSHENAVQLSGTVNLTAKVVALDPGTRTVSLVGPSGRVVQIVAGDEVRDFNQIKTGDTVEATFYQSVALYLGDPANKPEVTASEVMASAEKDGKPMVMKLGTLDVSAVVRGVDEPNRLLTLETPEGNWVTTWVDPSVNTLDGVKVGDTVHARVTRSLAIEVKAP